MRPHLLTLSAFGPFPGEESVDFDDLGAAGLLLLHGETGAGKTSLLDAVGYALYGAVPGERDVRGVRSEHAPADAQTWVQLEFSVGDRRFQVRRSPKQEVPKQRGSGTTTRQPTVVLQEWDGTAWQPFATRLDEVGDLIGDLLGLSADQFHQVVLLPQGRFAAFLHAPAGEREKLLRTLFGTEHYARVEDELAARRREAQETVDDVRRRIEMEVTSLERRVGADVDDTDRPLGHPSRWASELAAGAEAEVATAEAALSRATCLQQQAAEALTAAKTLAEAQRRRRQLEVELTALLEDAPAQHGRQQQLQLAWAAAPLAADLARQADAEEAVRAADGVVVETMRSLPEGTGREVPVLQRLAASAQAEAAEARALLPITAQLRGDEAALAQRSIEAAQARDAVAAARAQVAVTAEQVEAAVQECNRVEALAAALDAARAAAAVAQDRWEAAQSLAPARSELATADAALQEAREKAVTAKERWLDLAGRRLDGMAAELAGGLVPGEACAVCGSPEHPAPAEPADGAVAQEDVTAAQSVADAAEAEVDAARRRQQDAAEALAGLVARLGSDTADLTALESAATAAVTAGEAAEQAAAALPGVQRALAELCAARPAAEAALEAADARASAVEAQATAMRATVAERRQRVDEARGDDPDVETRVQRAEGLAGAATAAVEAVRALARAQQARDRLQSDLATAVRGAGFDAADDARAALRSDTEIEELKAAVTAHDTAVVSLRARLAEPSLDVPVDPPADAEAATEAAAAAAAEAREAADHRAAALQLLREAQATVRRLVDLETELAPAEERLSLVRGLAELAAGGQGNRLNMSLSSFVLAARLEAVAARASVRLSHMSSGRFTLVHTDDLLDGRRRSGLGLAVRDLWTGGQRPTSSLSGGETFMTALSLALGLADVVAEESGGRRLDTLFVDEGFGSLDEHALDRVMEVLDGLRDGGRLVGLVSHVPELQRRAPARLEVLRGESGSRLRAHPAPLAD